MVANVTVPLTLLLLNKLGRADPLLGEIQTSTLYFQPTVLSKAAPVTDRDQRPLLCFARESNNDIRLYNKPASRNVHASSSFAARLHSLQPSIYL